MEANESKVAEIGLKIAEVIKDYEAEDVLIALINSALIMLKICVVPDEKGDKKPRAFYIWTDIFNTFFDE